MLRLKNITYNYPGTATGVSDISLHIKRGELVSIIGASGSGKSTILRLIVGFIKANAGLVCIDGKDVTALPSEKRELGVVFQSYSLFPHMRLWENVAYPLKVRGKEREERRVRAMEMLERVGMGHRCDAYPSALSGGQQQRVALARALIFNPVGLLLDEPLSALDSSLRQEMRDEILKVQRSQNIATLLVTHDQEEAFSISDKVAVMSDGHILQIATPKELYESPCNVKVAAFVGQSNLWYATVQAHNVVQTGFGILSCKTGSFNLGSRVMVLVRPERILPIKVPDRVNSFSGSILADRYLGSLRRLDIQMANEVVKIETHFHENINHFIIPPEAVCLLPIDKNDGEK
ncbi:ABC transporter ATP-binding protein [Bartonella tamiae]|uniref:ABC transporter ATP-binding protein n=1 Tax=Bartonella tamiae TaxID=373638 RepID=UPI00026E7D50|nr:ABC transporter ATP-binding protein [Bartonella tamiae]EJF95401.1 hypothetical protein MEG_00134 [Bartonella tamiae Th307]